MCAFCLIFTSIYCGDANAVACQLKFNPQIFSLMFLRLDSNKRVLSNRIDSQKKLLSRIGLRTSSAGQCLNQQTKWTNTVEFFVPHHNKFRFDL